MKKTKLIMPIAVVSAIGAIAPITTITSCSKLYNTVTLVSGSANREVSSVAKTAKFQFKQENLKEPESTKVKLSNLVVNGTSVTPVAGLVKSTADYAGNINVYFNIDIAKTQYTTEAVNFDLVFTNKKANTSYTLTGFSVTCVDIEVQEKEFWEQYDYNREINFASLPEYSQITLSSDSKIKMTAKEAVPVKGNLIYNTPVSCDLLDANDQSILTQTGATIATLFYSNFANCPSTTWQEVFKQWEEGCSSSEITCTINSDASLTIVLKGVKTGYGTLEYTINYDSNSFISEATIKTDTEDSYIKVAGFVKA